MENFLINAEHLKFILRSNFLLYRSSQLVECFVFYSEINRAIFIPAYF